MREFLDGARDMDDNFKNKELTKNIPLLLGIIDFYHISI